MNDEELYIFNHIFFLLSGCALVTGTPNHNISVQARGRNVKEIKEAVSDLINKSGTWFIITPGIEQIHRSNDDPQIICKKKVLIIAEHP